MTTGNARSAFLRSYHLLTILRHYPRLIRAVKRVANLGDMEAAACIRELKAGRRWSGFDVDRYGGTHKVVADALSHRRPS